MSRLFVASLAVIFSAAAGYASAQTADPEPQTPREALEWMVLNEINGADFDRSRPMDRPGLVTRVPEGVIGQVDISHDGVADWLIDYEDSGLRYCGTGGCQRSLYVSVPDGRYVLAFNDQSYDFVIAQRGPETVIDMAVHQVMCTPMKRDCAYSFAWDPEAMRLVERPNVRGETLISSPFGTLGTPEQTDPQPPEGAPEVLLAGWRQTARACASTLDDGTFEIRHADISSIPDLDGDGVRDWIYRPPNDCGGADSAPGDPKPFAIYLARPEGEAELAFTSEPGERPVYDIATRPAVLISNPDCEVDVPCRNRRLTWDARTSGFVSVDEAARSGG